MFWRRPEKVCYIHIGPHKTGTSTIQHFMSNNAVRLEKHGFHYPRLYDRPDHYSRNHSALSPLKNLDDGRIDPSATLWSEIAAVAARGRRTIVLSSEFFARSFSRRPKLDAVCDFFERYGYRVAIVAYVRDQPIWLNSWYMQSQKRFSTRASFREFVDLAAKSGTVDPWRYLAQIIGNPRVSLDVVSFEAAITSGLEQDFLRRIGGPLGASLKPAERRNQNAGLKSVYAAQEIMRRRPENIRAMADYKLIYKRFRQSYERLGWNATPYVGLTPELYAHIRAVYRDGNERFAEAYLGASWSELCPERGYDARVFDPAAATAQEVDEIEAVVDDMVRTIAASAGTRGRETVLEPLP